MAARRARSPTSISITTPATVPTDPTDSEAEPEGQAEAERLEATAAPALQVLRWAGPVDRWTADAELADRWEATQAERENLLEESHRAARLVQEQQKLEKAADQARLDWVAALREETQRAVEEAAAAEAQCLEAQRAQGPRINL